MNRETTHTGMNGRMFDRWRTMRGLFAIGAMPVLAACGSAQADGTEDAAASDEETADADLQAANAQIYDLLVEQFRQSLEKAPATASVGRIV